MSAMVCRLCLTKDKLIDVFDDRLTNSEQLRKCILLGTGVEIRPDDIVSKFVCQECSDTAIFLYKYRKKALISDKTLKELAEQNYTEAYSKINDIIKLNGKILNELFTKDVDTTISKVRSSSKPITSRKINAPNLAVHPTIVQLIKKYPKLKLPNNLLKCHIQPSVVLDIREVEEWKPSFKRIEEKGIPVDGSSPLEKFKLKCPGISIMKVKQEVVKVERGSVINTANKVLVERKTPVPQCSTTPDPSIRKRRDSTLSQGSAKSSKKPRTQSPVITTSTSTEKQIPKLVINMRKSSIETSTVQETRDRTPTPSTLLRTQVTGLENKNVTEPVKPKKLNRKRILPSDSDDSDYRPDVDEVSEASDELLDTFDEEIVITCGICNKMFTTRQHLKSHERVHRRCTICNGIFRTNELLRYHQQEICFKNIIVNSPNLKLVRVDEQPEILRAYPNAFNPELEDTFEIQPRSAEATVISDDDDDVIVVEDNRPITNTQNVITDSPEYQQICKIFQKYKHLDHKPLTKDKNTETKPRICVKYNVKNQIVLENMYSELQIYRVPVDLVAKPTSFAYISFSKKQIGPKDIYCWATQPVIGLGEKNKLFTLLNSKSVTSNPQPNPISTTVSNNPQPNPISTSQPKIQVSQRYRPIIPKAGMEVLKLLNTAAQIKSVNNTTTSTQLQQGVASTSKTVDNKQPSLSSESIVIDVDEDTPEPVPSTSGVSGFSLRIKTPSELNTGIK